jgi:hypothetical protein
MYQWRNERQHRGPKVRNVCLGDLPDSSAEITDSTNEARAFSIFPICLNLGIIIASVLGGSLANTRGWTISQYLPIFESYPYLLPMLLASLFPLISGTCAFFFLKETLPETHSSETAKKDEISYRKLLTPHISLIMATFGILSLLGIMFMALLPLFCFTPVKEGGLGFNSTQIGLVISQRSAMAMFASVIIYPWIQSKFTPARLFKILMMFWTPTVFLLPLSNLFARANNITLVWICLYGFMVLGSLAGMAFGMI